MRFLSKWHTLILLVMLLSDLQLLQKSFTNHFKISIWCFSWRFVASIITAVAYKSQFPRWFHWFDHWFTERLNLRFEVNSRFINFPLCRSIDLNFFDTFWKFFIRILSAKNFRQWIKLFSLWKALIRFECFTGLKNMLDWNSWGKC